MDERTQRELQRIEARMPAHLKRGLMKTVTDDSQMQRANDVLTSKHSSVEEKLHVRRMMARGAFKPRSEQIIDEKVAKQIDTYHEREVRRAIQEGRVTDPKKDCDPWLQKRQKKV